MTPFIEDNGSYLTSSQTVPAEKLAAWARDKIDAEKLWKLSEEIVGQKFVY